MASFQDTMNVYTPKINEWEGGSQHYNQERDTWTAYDDEIGGNIPTLAAGVTGQVGGQDIQIGQEYPSELVNQEMGNRMRGDYDWLGHQLGDSFNNLNPNQQSSVMSLVHNVGRTGFGRSNAFKNLQSGDLKGFALEAFDPEVGFVRSGEIDPETGRKKVIPGLQNRRGYESELFSTPYGDEELVDNVVTEQGSEAF